LASALVLHQLAVQLAKTAYNVVTPSEIRPIQILITVANSHVSICFVPVTVHVFAFLTSSLDNLLYALYDRPGLSRNFQFVLITFD